MPFDRLPGHSLKTPEYHPYIPPPRPVIPWAQYIVPAVDKIAQSLAYTFSPYEKQMRGAELAKAQVGQMEAQQNLALARPMMALKQSQIQTQQEQNALTRQMMEQYKAGGGQNGNLIWDGTRVRPKTLKELNESVALQQKTDEANSAANYGSQAEQYRKANGTQPQSPTDDDENFWLKYHAAVAKHGEGNFQYDDNGNPVPYDDE